MCTHAIHNNLMVEIKVAQVHRATCFEEVQPFSFQVNQPLL